MLFQPVYSTLQYKDVSTLKTLPESQYDEARPKQKSIIILSPQQQPGLQLKLKT